MQDIRWIGGTEYLAVSDDFSRGDAVRGFLYQWIHDDWEPVPDIPRRFVGYTSTEVIIELFHYAAAKEVTP